MLVAMWKNPPPKNKASLKVEKSEAVSRGFIASSLWQSRKVLWINNYATLLH